MKFLIPITAVLVILAVVTCSPQAAIARPRVTMYEGYDSRGSFITLTQDEPDFRRLGIDKQISSVIVYSGIWQICPDINYRGTCLLLKPGIHDLPSSIDNRASSMRLNALTQPWISTGSITLFDRLSAKGGYITLTSDVVSLRAIGISDQVSSVVINSGVWELCTDINYRGRCVTFSPGIYEFRSRSNQISSFRQIN